MSELAPSTAAPVARLIEAFHRLPGVGPKSAQRLTYHLVRMPREEAEELANAIMGVKERIVFCDTCMNISESSTCSICADLARDKTRICIVEEPLDVVAVERTHAFKGQYHVLHGVISPVNGIGPEDLKLKELLARLNDGEVTEAIVATNPNLEGEATAMYINRLLTPLGIKVTALARGLPSGADLEYADDSTLAHALESRAELQSSNGASAGESELAN